MRYSLFVGALLAGIATAGSATAGIILKQAPPLILLHSMGQRPVTGLRWLKKETRLPSRMWDECCITDKACAATRLKPINCS